MKDMDVRIVERVFWVALEFGCYYAGKHTADEWYAKHPVVQTVVATGSCPDLGTFHHDHVTVYFNNNKLYSFPAVPKGKP